MTTTSAKPTVRHGSVSYCIKMAPRLGSLGDQTGIHPFTLRHVHDCEKGPLRVPHRVALSNRPAPNCEPISTASHAFGDGKGILSAETGGSLSARRPPWRPDIPKNCKPQPPSRGHHGRFLSKCKTTKSAGTDGGARRNRTDDLFNAIYGRQTPCSFLVVPSHCFY